MPGPLSHIKVIDLSRVLAAPWTGQNLADLGAEVIKIERPKNGDDSRAFGPPWLKDEDGKDTTESAYFACANRGKKSVTRQSLEAARGRRSCASSPRSATCCSRTTRSATSRATGSATRTSRRSIPRLIYCSVTGFGQTGPYAERPGYDFMIQGMGGLMSITGERDDLPGGGPQKAASRSPTS